MIQGLSRVVVDHRGAAINTAIVMSRAAGDPRIIKTRVGAPILIYRLAEETVRDVEVLPLDELGHALESQVVDTVVVARYAGHCP